MLRWLLSLFFHLLYHPLAWAYDLIAWIVSRGRWRGWVLSSLPFIPPGPVLELGSGPGHLLVELSRRPAPVAGIDSSLQMTRLARKNITRHRSATSVLLARSIGQFLPFAGSQFSSVVATFPAPYIFDSQTLSEIRRVIIPGGTLIILLAAKITGSGMIDKALRLIYHATGESPSPHQLAKLNEPLIQAGFIVEQQWIEQNESRLLFLIAKTNIVAYKK